MKKQAHKANAKYSYEVDRTIRILKQRVAVNKAKENYEQILRMILDHPERLKIYRSRLEYITTQLEERFHD